MRLMPFLLVLPLFALQAQAQSVSPGAPAAAMPAASTAAPAAAPLVTAAAPVGTAASSADAAPKAPHHRMSWQERFAEANTSHDGHLTLQQAEDGYRTVARHFKQIDVDKKGFVTIEDINAWHKMQRAMRHSNANSSGEVLRPRPAMQHSLQEPRQINTSSDTQVAPMTQSDAVGTPASSPDASGAASHHGT